MEGVLCLHDLRLLLLRFLQAVEAASSAERKWPPPPLCIVPFPIKFTNPHHHCGLAVDRLDRCMERRQQHVPRCQVTPTAAESSAEMSSMTNWRSGLIVPMNSPKKPTIRSRPTNGRGNTRSSYTQPSAMRGATAARSRRFTPS